MKTLTLRTLALAAFTFLVLPASAQTAHNRRVSAVAIAPTATPGQYEINAAVLVGLGAPTSTPLDLSTEVQFFVNGTLVGSHTTAVQADAGAGFCSLCTGGCGGGYIDGVFNTLLCLPDLGSPTGSGCHCQFPPLLAPHTTPLSPGDEIMVLLRPAPGALPEIDPSDDTETLTFSGDPIVWNRRLTTAQLEPAPGAPAGVFDLEVGFEVEMSALGNPSPIGFSLDVMVNGTLAHIWEPPCGPWYSAGSTCLICDGSLCGSIQCNGQTVYEARCQLDNDGNACGCFSTASIIIPGVTLTPGDELTVFLKPTPGALPELPGLDDDDDLIAPPPFEVWTDLGNALAGSHGDPANIGTGTLMPNTALTLTLVNALENTTSWLVVGMTDLSAPFKGGVLVPDPAAPGLILQLPTGAAGVVNLAALWPPGFPSGFKTYYQWWIQDGAGPVGFAASNALSATTP